jgi:23S rRNA pseudouridine1911/1915/1917 synthase
MKNGEIQKQYIAILDGDIPEDEGVIETYMKRTEESIIVRMNCNADEGGDYALTHYKCICRRNGMSLVSAFPKTGRTHQLRVHFASLGCPILSDELYGKKDGRIGRHALHARSLTLPHPVTKEIMTFNAAMPEDMRALCESLFGYIEK